MIASVSPLRLQANGFFFQTAPVECAGQAIAQCNFLHIRNEPIVQHQDETKGHAHQDQAEKKKSHRHERHLCIDA
jgi:hypothetical protein